MYLKVIHKVFTEGKVRNQYHKMYRNTEVEIMRMNMTSIYTPYFNQSSS
jgi:hypothetical protein